ncbi:MAG TPA: hypothetical protein VFB29_14215 [Pseudolabrys sp.]|nr:hypothetical protein [Pseudolabrys sp.]
MKAFHVVTLSLLAALAAPANEAARAQGVNNVREDNYVRKVPLEDFKVPIIPIIPPGSSLDLRPGRTPDSADQIGGYTPSTRESTTPSIGLSIKGPFDDRK